MATDTSVPTDGDLASGHAALCTAVNLSHDTIVKTLADAGVLDLNAECSDRGGWTPLYMAVYYARNDIVRILVDAGANPNASGDTETVLCNATYYARVESVGILVEAGADVNANCGYASEERSDWTPLYVATYLGRSSMVKILVDAGALR